MPYTLFFKYVPSIEEKRKAVANLKHSSKTLSLHGSSSSRGLLSCRPNCSPKSINIGIGTSGETRNSKNRNEARRAKFTKIDNEFFRSSNPFWVHIP
jgi:hypothetical protein